MGCRKTRREAFVRHTVLPNDDFAASMTLDAIDIRILSQLQQDCSLTNVELARRVHLSPSPCLARVKALESAGVIARYVALADAKSLGLGLNVFINISLKSQAKEALAEFERRIADHHEVMECYLMTGDSDYLIRIAVADLPALERFILEQLTPIPGIEKIRSSFALKQVRYKTALPLPGQERPAATTRRRAQADTGSKRARLR
jgi:Lrp/AsnC family transcriptional regulator, leucine-responsive regulatory protein